MNKQRTEEQKLDQEIKGKEVQDQAIKNKRMEGKKPKDTKDKGIKAKGIKDKGVENKTKEAILDSALKIFLAKGYEGTSVRMILEDANVVTGSFYHFFKSKEDLFEKVVERFLVQYQKQFAAIASEDTHSLEEKLNQLAAAIDQNTNAYFESLQAEKLHWTIQYALHKRTLQALVPSVERLLEKGIEKGEVSNPLGFDLRTLAAVLIDGIEGIVHAKPFDQIDEKGREQMRQNVLSYAAYVLGSS